MKNPMKPVLFLVQRQSTLPPISSPSTSAATKPSGSVAQNTSASSKPGFHPSRAAHLDQHVQLIAGHSANVHVVRRHYSCGDTAAPLHRVASSCHSAPRRTNSTVCSLSFCVSISFPLSTLGAGHSSQVTSFPTAAASEDSLRSTKDSQLFSASSARNYAETAMLRQAQSARWQARCSHSGSSV